MKNKVKSFSALRRSCSPLPTRGVILCTPTANATAAIARPRSLHVVESAPAALRRYEDAVMALLAEVSIFRLDEREALGTFYGWDLRRIAQ